MAALTYSELIGQIASRLNRSDLDPDPAGVFVIRNTVVDRIDYYKKECFYDGLVNDDSITTVAGTRYYDWPDGWEEVEQIQILNGVWLTLTKKTHEYLNGIDVNETPIQSLPIYWAPFGNQFRLFPTPGTTYSVKITMNVPNSAPADNASNFWTGDAKSLVINGAAAEISSAYLHDPIKESIYRPLEQRELLAMQTKTMRIRGGIQIQGHL